MLHCEKAAPTCLGVLQVMRNNSRMPRPELQMTALLTHLSGKCLKACVTEKHLNGRGCPCFMITLALNIIKTNPFTCLHFLQAICLGQNIKKVWMFVPTRFSQYLQHLGGSASPNNSSSKHSAILKGLEHTEHNGVSK